MRAFPISFLFLLFSLSISYAQADFTLLTWNIRDFGKTKDEVEIERMTEIVKDFDILAIQEVVAGYGGSQAVAKLAASLNRTGQQWDYAVSDPTKSPKYKTERYAYIWKRNKAQLIGRPWLEKALQQIVFREPYMARFLIDNREVVLMNYHARKHSDQPEQEVKQFKKIYFQYYLNTPFIIAGDFNLKDKHTVFFPLKKSGFDFVLENEPTTLKRKCDAKGKMRNHPIDNLFYSPGLNCKEGFVVNPIRGCFDLETFRGLSDHLPVVAQFSID